jgi:hypothetical protein
VPTRFSDLSGGDAASHPAQSSLIRAQWLRAATREQDCVAYAPQWRITYDSEEVRLDTWRGPRRRHGSPSADMHKLYLPGSSLLRSETQKTIVYIKDSTKQRVVGTAPTDYDGRPL